jgi:hypothetical protein
MDSNWKCDFDPDKLILTFTLNYEEGGVKKEKEMSLFLNPDNVLRKAMEAVMETFAQKTKSAKP